MMLEAILSEQAIFYLQWFVVLVVLTSPVLLSLCVLLWTKRKGLSDY